MRKRSSQDDYLGPADRSLHDAFSRYGTEEAEKARSDRPHPRQRHLAFGVVGALLVLGGGGGLAVATGLLGGNDDPIKIDRNPGSISEAPVDRRLAYASAPDPVGGRPWGLRLYQDRENRTCVVVGQIEGGTVGRVDPDNSFHAFPGGTPGACGDLSLGPIITSRMYTIRRPPRTVLYGVVDRDVRALELVGPGQTRRPVKIAREDGTYIVVLRGGRALRGAALHFTFWTHAKDKFLPVG